jgi:hypothetical protein
MDAIKVAMESVSELVPFGISGAVALTDQNNVIFNQDRVTGLV